MGVVLFNAQTYGGKDKTRHKFGTKSLCAVSNKCLVYYLNSYVLAPNSYLTVAPSVRKWSNTTQGQMDRQTYYRMSIALHMCGED